jgi:hypothetical protein
MVLAVVALEQALRRRFAVVNACPQVCVCERERES